MLLQVAVIEMEETSQLYDDTRNIYASFNPNRVKLICELVSDRAATAQSLFSSAILSGRETQGIELDEPTYKYVTFSSHGNREGEKAAGWSSKTSKFSSSSQSLNTVCVRDDKQVMSAPKLPPRETPTSEEEGQRSYTECCLWCGVNVTLLLSFRDGGRGQDGGRGWHTLPHTTKDNSSPTVPCLPQAIATSKTAEHIASPDHTHSPQIIGVKGQRSIPRPECSQLNEEEEEEEELSTVLVHRMALVEQRLAAMETLLQAFREDSSSNKDQEVKWRQDMEQRIMVIYI